jgi:hypothetical protein
MKAAMEAASMEPVAAMESALRISCRDAAACERQYSDRRNGGYLQ